MVISRRKPEDLKRVCPGCGSDIKLPSSIRSRNVQCPKCRKIVGLDTLGESPGGKTPAPPGSHDTVHEPGRVEALEARVAALEETVKNFIGTASAPAAHTAKLRWVPGSATGESGISADQESALSHNLSDLPRLQIAIRSAPGDPLARERADWFRTVFERAKWAVRGPGDATAEEAGGGLYLGVGSLPVSPEAAATYLALRAAGFPATPILDPDLARASGDGFTLSLIVGSAGAA